MLVVKHGGNTGNTKTYAEIRLKEQRKHTHTHVSMLLVLTLEQGGAFHMSDFTLIKGRRGLPFSRLLQEAAPVIEAPKLANSTRVNNAPCVSQEISFCCCSVTLRQVFSVQTGGKAQTAFTNTLQSSCGSVHSPAIFDTPANTSSQPIVQLILPSHARLAPAVRSWLQPRKRTSAWL